MSINLFNKSTRSCFLTCVLAFALHNTVKIAKASFDRPTLTPELCRSNKYISRDERKLLEYDDFATICGTGSLPNTQEFKNGWLIAVNQCVNGEQLNLHKKLRDVSLGTGFIWSIQCSRVFDIAISYKVLSSTEVDGLKLKMTRNEDERGARIEKLTKDANQGNSDALLVLLTILLDLERTNDRANMTRVEEAREVVKKLAKAGKSDNVYAYLLSSEAKYPFLSADNSARKIHILHMHGALSNSGYALSTLRIAQEYIEGLQSASSTGAYIDKSTELYKAREVIRTARQQAVGPLQQKVNELEILLEQADSSTIAMQAIFKAIAALVSRIPERKISGKDNYDLYLENMREVNAIQRQNCANQIDLYYRSYDPNNYVPGYGNALCP